MRARALPRAVSSGRAQPLRAAPVPADDAHIARRYHIDTAPAPDRVRHPPRFRVRVRKTRLVRLVLRELLALEGPHRARVALSRPCVYGVFGRPVGGLWPKHELCVGCLRCTTQYPEVVQIEPNPERLRLGDAYLGPDAVDTILYEARTGRVPVRGAGYRGPFGGEDWDGMWTDMSEIVRPTRDGIHGREYISTLVDIGAKPPFLRFDDRGDPTGEVPRVIALPVPFVFDGPPPGAPCRLADILAAAAERLDTLAVLPLRTVLDRRLAGPAVAPLVGCGEVSAIDRLAGRPRLIELDGWDAPAFAAARALAAAPLVAVRVPMEQDVRPLVDAGVRVIHLVADYHGRAAGRFALEWLREVHDALVDAGVREEVTLLASGGIALAEHVPKAIICGADAVGLDTALWVALQARFAGECRDRQRASVAFPALDLPWGVRRLTNLANAWRDQLLEVLGAMGLREVRRLRGEVGRAMFQRDLEREAFDGIAGYASAT